MTEEVNYSVGQLLEAINNKADLDGSNLDNTSFETFINSLVDAKLGNIDYVIESKLPTDDDPTWYRVYKSGWIEQGGRYNFSSSAYTQFNLIKEMANTDYFLIASFIDLAAQNTSAYPVSVGNLTTKTFMAKSGVSSTTNHFFSWQVSGQSA